MMNIIQTAIFKKQVKKLHPNQKNDLDQVVTKIICDPDLGDAKKGDLLGVQVYKFNMVKKLTLLAYEWHPETQSMVLLYLGFHENFYRDLKK